MKDIDPENAAYDPPPLPEFKFLKMGDELDLGNGFTFQAEDDGLYKIQRFNNPTASPLVRKIRQFWKRGAK